MRIGIDARFVTRYPRRGIGNYSLHLIRELIRLAPHHLFVLYISAEDKEEILPKEPNVTVRPLSTPTYPLWEQFALPRAAKSDKLDILHCLGNTALVWRSSPCKIVLSLMDVMFLHSGDFVPRPTNNYQALGRLYRQAVVPTCARSADEIVTISEFSKQDILATIHGLHPNKIHVTHLSCDSAFRAAIVETQESGTLSQPRPYLLALGAEDPRKNTLRLVRSYLLLLEQYGIEDDLVISGYVNWKNSEAYQLIVKAGATQRVRFLSYVTLDELVALYRNARIFIYPSLYEGFGIPLLEAFSAGCPVIASNITSIPEVAGDAALYVNPANHGDIAMMILRLLKDHDLRNALSERGRQRAEQFTWSETARKTIAIYEKCISEIKA